MPMLNKEVIMFAIVGFFGIVGIFQVTLALSSWKRRIIAWLLFLAAALVFVLAYLSRR